MIYYLLAAGRIAIKLILAVVCIRLAVLFVAVIRKSGLINALGVLKPQSVRGKWLIVFGTILFALFYGVVAVENYRQSAVISITLTYPEASSGLNPNGSRYNMSDILSDEVLEKAIAFGGFSNTSADDLKASMDVSPADENGTSETVSTQFILSFAHTSRTGDLNGREVVYAVASAYKEWFIGSYSVNYDVLDISFDNIEKYDYLDIRNYLDDAIKTVCSFTEAYASKNSSFQSETTGETFRSINKKGWDLYNSGLEGMESYILSKGLSKDSPAYLGRLRYKYTKLCNQYRKKIQAYDVRLEAINKYDSDMSTVVYIPVYDKDETFYMSKTKTGIDHFSAAADAYSSSASEILSDILDNEYMMQRLMSSSGTESDREKVDEQIASLETQVLTLAQLAKQTTQDYIDETYNGYINISKPEDSMMLQYMQTGFAGIAFFIIVYVGNAFSQLNRKNRKIMRIGDGRA